MHKVCRDCQKEKPPHEFPVRKDRSSNLRPYCKQCANDIKRARYRAHKRENPFKWKCSKAKSRASNLNVPFDLTPEYLEQIWTDCCPVSGEEMKWNADRSDPLAAELDRIDPEKGYTKGNVVFMSRKMNRLKNNGNIEEILKLAKWLKEVYYGA